MYDELRTFLNDKGMTTHTFYLDELIEGCEANDDELPNEFRAWAIIDTQARLDLWFQEHHNQALDYCHDQGDGTWACMTVDDQIEYIVRPDFHVVSESDGMGR